MGFNPAQTALLGWLGTAGYTEVRLCGEEFPATFSSCCANSHGTGEICAAHSGSQEGGVVSAGSTSPTSMQTKCTSHQHAPEEQEEEMAITSSYWIEIKGESRDFNSP